MTDFVFPPPLSPAAHSGVGDLFAWGASLGRDAPVVSVLSLSDAGHWAEVGTGSAEVAWAWLAVVVGAPSRLEAAAAYVLLSPAGEDGRVLRGAWFAFGSWGQLAYAAGLWAEEVALRAVVG